MNLKYLIYGLVDPRDGQLRYIGKSSSGRRRPQAHGSPSYLARDTTYKANWIRSLKSLGLSYKIVIIHEFQEPEILGLAETFWIAYFRGLGAKLTNLTDGGEGYNLTPEHKAKIQDAHLRSGHKPLESTWRKALEVRQADPNSSLKLAQGHKGYKTFKDQCGNIYITIQGAARQLGLSAGNVHSVLNKHPAYRHTKGYVFRYTDEPDITPEEYLQAINHKSQQTIELNHKKATRHCAPFRDEDGNIYNYPLEAAKLLNLVSSNIHKALRGELKSTGGHRFKFC